MAFKTSKVLFPLLLFVLLSASGLAQNTATITAHVSDPGGTATSKVFMRAELKNTGGQQCKIGGVALVSPYVKDFTPNATGDLSFSIYKTSVITCGTSTGNAQWAFTLWKDGHPAPSCFLQPTTSTLDLDSASCLNATQTPTTTVPTSSLFALIDGSNAGFTGTITAPSVTISGALSVGLYTRDCRQDGTLDPTGTNDASAVINTCTANAVTNKQSDIVLPCGIFKINTTVNWTNRPGINPSGCAEQFVFQQSAVSGVGTTQFLCNTGTVCVDTTGSGDIEVKNLILILAGSGITTPTPIGFLRGRDNAGGGGVGNNFCFAQNQRFKNVVVLDLTSGGLNTTANGGRGYIAMYNYGAESGLVENFGFFTATPMVYTNTNIASVSSPYQTIGTGCPVTMTGEKLDTGTLTASQAAGPVGKPNIEADGTANMMVINTTFIGGNCGITFEGKPTVNGATGTAYAGKWHVVMNQESLESPGYSLCTSVAIRDSFFHIESAPTAFINPTANSLSLINNEFLFSTDVAEPPISNTATGTQIAGGYLSFGQSANLTLTNTTVLGTRVMAPNATKAQLQAMFSVGSSYDFSASDGSGRIGLFLIDTIKQINSATTFQIVDSAGAARLFVFSGPSANTFIQGSGAGNVLIGSANKVSVSDAGALTVGNGVGGVAVTILQHKRISTGSLTGTTRAEVLLTWTTTMGDTAYTVQCNVEDSTTAAATQGLTFERIRTKSATQIGAVINNPTAGAITGTLDCTAFHD